MILPALSHINRLTDDTGLLQFAIHSIPDPQYGYTLDDNARALLVSSAYYHLNSERNIAEYLVYRYLAFLRWSQLADGWFHNELGYDRRWLDDRCSEDAYGRAIWALGYAATHPVHSTTAGAAIHMLTLALPQAKNLQYVRGCAYTILGLFYLIQQNHPLGDRLLMQQLAEKIHKILLKNARSDWYWPEEMLTYDNGRIPQAMIAAGYTLNNHLMLLDAKKVLSFLISHVVENEIIIPIGNKGWFGQGASKARYDQQPIDAASLADVCAFAWRIFRKQEYAEIVRMSWAWFHGHNSEQIVLYDIHTGGCRDGLGQGHANENQGAESSLALLQAALVVYELSSEI